jgi:undecaprenyl pyrophosphate phosphatase UppP
LGAALLETRKIEGFTGDWAGVALGSVVALAAGVAAIYIVLASVRGRKFGWFGVYCAAVGLAVLLT